MSSLYDKMFFEKKRAEKYQQYLRGESDNAVLLWDYEKSDTEEDIWDFGSIITVLFLYYPHVFLALISLVKLYQQFRPRLHGE